jgi:hypothetical protein
VPETAFPHWRDLRWKCGFRGHGLQGVFGVQIGIWWSLYRSESLRGNGSLAQKVMIGMD